MTNKKLIRSIVISISLAVLAIAGIGFACGWDGYEDDNYNSFFTPEVSNNAEAEPFFKSYHAFYGDLWIENNLTTFDTTNIDEWKSILTGVKQKDIHYLLYKARLGEIDTMIFFLKNNAYPIKPYLKKNSLFLLADKNICGEFLYYVGFARRCEPYATYAPEWWDDSGDDDPKKDKATIQKLIIGGKKQLLNVKTGFIRDRYIFQITRLYFNIADYNACAAYYKENAANFTVKNSIPYRAMGYAAGALYKMQDYSTANYYYSLCFDSSPELKYSSYLSFHPQDEQDWEQSLALAATSREKQVLWHLLGIYADPLRAMKEIYALDPKSDLLDLLLVRAVNQEEVNLSQNSNLSDFAVNTDLITFVKNVADKKNTLKPYLWNLVTGYFYTLSTDYKKAEAYLSRAEASSKHDTLVTDQIHIFRLIARVNQYKPGLQAEADILKELQWLAQYNHNNSLRTAFMYDWTLKQLSAKYYNAGDTAKAVLLSREVSADYYNSFSNSMKIVDFMSKPNKTAFENYLLEIYSLSPEEIINYQAVNFFYEGKLNEAKALLDKYPDSGETTLPADPFLIHINDCHDCDHMEGSEIVYTLKSLLDKIMELEKSIKSSSGNSAKTYYLLANAYYNVTYFGNSRAFYYSEIPGRDEYTWSALNPVMDCTKAMEYYEKAMELATSKEFKAQCCFMASKCEQNLLYLNWPEDYDGDFKSGNYFRLLRDEYSKTKYYQEIIKECGYFRTFVNSY